MTLLRAVVRDKAVAILTAANTLAGGNVYSSRDTSLQQGTAPTILVYVLSEHGQASGAQGHQGGAGAPHFATLLTLMIECITSGYELRQVEQDLDTLSEQTVEGLLRSPAFTGLQNPDGGGQLFEGFSNLSITLDFRGDSDRHLGSARIGIGIRYHDVYQPIIAQPLTAVSLTVGRQEANAAPGTKAPDGRPEIGALINLPQT